MGLFHRFFRKKLGVALLDEVKQDTKEDKYVVRLDKDEQKIVRDENEVHTLAKQLESYEQQKQHLQQRAHQLEQQIHNIQQQKKKLKGQLNIYGQKFKRLPKKITLRALEKLGIAPNVMQRAQSQLKSELDQMQRDLRAELQDDSVLRKQEQEILQITTVEKKISHRLYKILLEEVKTLKSESRDTSKVIKIEKKELQDNEDAEVDLKNVT